MTPRYSTAPQFLALALAITLALAPVLALTPSPARAAPAATLPATKPGASGPASPASPRGLTVAILDFDAHDPTQPNLGRNLTDITAALLSGEPGFTLVDRASIDKLIKEHELNLTGVVDSDQAVKVGKLIGARIMIVGKVFPVQKQLYMTAKIIGTETSLVEATLVKAPLDTGPDELAMRIAEDIAKRLRERGAKLVAGDDLDPLPAIKAKLAKLKLPTVAVIIPEEHISRRVVDPAVETEIKKMLIECGFTVQDVTQNDLADWARTMSKDDVNSWPRGLTKVDLVITGAAFSELGARIGNLITCSARAEINAIRRSDGKVVLADRVNTRGVDLTESVASKKALQSAGRTLGVQVLEHFVKTLPPAEPAKAP